MYNKYKAITEIMYLLIGSDHNVSMILRFKRRKKPQT